MLTLDPAALCGGGILQRLREELEKAVENCLDENTKACAERAVVLRIRIRPEKTRNFAEVWIEVNSRLCPRLPLETELAMSRDVDGNARASEIPWQAPLAIADIEKTGEAEKEGAKISAFASRKGARD